MSQDGSWQKIRARAGLDESKAAKIRERHELEQRAEQAERIVAALVRKYGEPIGDGIRRAVLTEAELTEIQDGTLSINLDPCSGAVLIRFRPL